DVSETSRNGTRMSGREPSTYTLRLPGNAPPSGSTANFRSITSVISASMRWWRPEPSPLRDGALPAPALPGSGSAVGGLEPPSQPGPTELPPRDGTPRGP